MTHIDNRLRIVSHILCSIYDMTFGSNSKKMNYMTEVY